jgi:phosphatidate cytidylyltransferase
VFSKFLINPQILEAMLLLYAVLATASIGVSFFSSKTDQPRNQVNAWWYIFPVVSLSLFLYPAGPLLMALAIAVLAIRELSLHHAGACWLLMPRC